MCLIPAVLVPDAQLGVVVKQCFAAGGVSPCQHSVVERRQPSPVLVVRRGSQRQQDLQDHKVTGELQKLCKKINEVSNLVIESQRLVII